MFCSRCGTEVQTSSKFCPTCGLDLTTITGTGRPGAPSASVTPQAPEQDETQLVREALKEEYDLEKELGRGGMAVVYKARDKTLEREVAIKVLPFSLSFDAEFVERFQREARTAGKLEHPNIIPIYRVGRSGRVIYFVMKFIRGKSLSAVVESRGAMPVPEIKRMLVEAARALGYAHKHGIVHRDIKPDNIMFDELGQAIVTDFGIAKAQSGARLTGTGMSIGTPHYMSPEQARAQNLDGRSDIYSLGVLTYQCLTGHVPFDGEDSFSIGYKHIMEELPTPPLETADQREMFSIIQKMMAKKPDDRFQTAEELIASLEGVSGAAMSVADMSTMPTRAIEPVKKGATPPPAAAAAATAPLPRASASMGKPASIAAAEAKKAARAPAKKSNMPLIAAAALGVVALGGGGYYQFVVKPKQHQPVATLPAAPDTRPQAVTPPPIDSAKRDTPAAPAPPATNPAAPITPTTTAQPVRPGTATPTQPAPAQPTPAQPARPAAQGTLVLAGLPAGAQIRIDRQSQTGTQFKLDAGRHQLAISAPGFRDYSSTVTIESNRTRNLSPNMTQVTAAQPTPAQPAPGAQPTPPTATPGAAPATSASPAARCSDPRFNMRNEQRACWDERPTPRGSLVIAAPETCAGRVSQAVILVQVGADGEVMGNPTATDNGSCRQFGVLAQSYASEMTFTPARKAGQPVSAWTQIRIQPQRQ